MLKLKTIRGQNKAVKIEIDYLKQIKFYVYIFIDFPTRDVRAFSHLTELMGQYLAFIYAYMRVLRRPPAEADIQRHFKVTAPTVHQMGLTLERNGLIKREQGIARSIQLMIAPEALPILRRNQTATRQTLCAEVLVPVKKMGIIIRRAELPVREASLACKLLPRAVSALGEK